MNTPNTSPTAPGRELSPEGLAQALGMHAPTPEQSRVIAHPLSPLLVVAGAGSGKTATMSQRVVYLVASGQVRPDQVLGLTFTRKATAELDQRVGTRLSQLAASGLTPAVAEASEPTISTYNAFAGSIVHEHGLRVGVAPDSTLITEARAWQIANRLVESCTEPLPVEKANSATSLLLRLDGALSENLLTAPAAAEQLADLEEFFTGLVKIRGLKSLVGKTPEKLATRRQILALVQDYRDYKRRHALLDFGDQIALACQICETVPEVASRLRSQYPAVLLDEFQDTSVAQLRLLSALFAGQGVTAVGDPNQAIYGWRGASAGALDTFHQRFNPAGTAAAQAGADPHLHTPVLPLSTAWRNDRRILAAANQTSSPLRNHQPQAGDPVTAHIPVAALAERPAATGLEAGLVLGAFLQDPLQEAEHIAAFMEEHWTPSAEMAVLCRTRDQFTPVAQALEAHGLPYEVVGLGGMLSVPEVADIRSLLTIALDPERGDRLMRLLTGRSVGVADLKALSRLARQLVRKPARPAPSTPKSLNTPNALDGAPLAADGAQAVSPNSTPNPDDGQDQPLLAEALELLTRQVDQAPGTAQFDGNQPQAAGLSEAGRKLAVDLGRAIRRARAATNLALPDQVVLAERALGLDIEVAARVGDPLGRRALDAFRATAEQFSAEMEAPTLADFLAWLDTAEERESGFAAPELEPEPGAIQILTIHAAKGLEWDTVSVCGLNEQVFPSYRSTPTQDGTLSTSGWMTSAEEFPHPLRADAETLPPFELGLLEPGSTDKDTAKELLTQYQAALGRHLLAEERRLAYVAFTRARHHLLLTGSHLAKSASKPRPMSRFLAELLRRGLVEPYADGWTELDPEALNPLSATQSTGLWPHESIPGSREALLHQARQRAAQAVNTARAAGSHEPQPASTDAVVNRWRQEAALLLAERSRQEDAWPAVHLPAHLAATKIDDLRQDRAQFALALRRPLPPRPSPSSRLGTVFHDAVAQHLAAQAGLISLQEAGVPETLAAADRRKIQEWLQVASSLPLLAGYQLEQTETELELTLAGVIVRCRMDAVFKRGEQDWLIVDWKTGTQAVPIEQLSIYVHAWARAMGVEPATVRAAYVYVAQKDPAKQVQELTAEQLLPLTELLSALRLDPEL
ncbi:ATP-dependent DNA helicase pcrA [Actinomyces bovis]|uniref:DNA 3'-5' helicase n=1 Tax=Actinomyces bovis TaxID=1658 RepID=A0ABY1VKX1_9ACTO|nr:ATP-dependent DNA helicase [Actinomyces bovis]SPT52736.1 ATP-dependent DNA helicase pcrA [Actinomyces bovis]VEG54716.1 ATP-dependent DNA helicase pcrA [Actinomyces israelii]